jgi:hypothetical protein
MAFRNSSSESPFQPEIRSRSICDLTNSKTEKHPDRREKPPLLDELLHEFGFLVGIRRKQFAWKLLMLVTHPDAWKACQGQVEQIYSKRLKETKESGDQNEVVLNLARGPRCLILLGTLRLYASCFTARTVKESFVLECLGNQHEKVCHSERI